MEYIKDEQVFWEKSLWLKENDDDIWLFSGCIWMPFEMAESQVESLKGAALYLPPAYPRLEQLEEKIPPWPVQAMALNKEVYQSWTLLLNEW